MKCRGAYLVSWLLLSCAVPVARAAGTLAGWGGTGEVGVRVETSQGHATARPFVRESGVRGWLSASLAGQLPEPRWFTWTWTARPSFVRTGGNTPGAAVGTDALAHQLVAASQPWHWLHAQYSADRDHVVADRGADASRESRSRRSEARAELRPPFATLGYSQRAEHTMNRWVSTALAPELERTLRRRTGEAWLESSRMRLLRRDVSERVPGSAFEIRTSHTTFDHTLSWGRGSRLSTRLEAAGQSPRGATLVDRVVQERVHLRHTSWLASDYRLEDTHARVTSGDATSRSHYAEVGGRLDGVGFSLGGGVRSDRSPGRAGSSWSAGPRASLQRAWPSGVRLSAQAGGSLERERRSGSLDAIVPVSDEPHTVPPSRSFALDVEGADSATVVVHDAAGSGGLSEGSDYTLLRSGLSLFVVVPFGSRITIGDRVRVSYEAVPPGLPGRRSLRSDAACALDWRSVSIGFDERRTHATDTPVDRGAAQLASSEDAARLAASVPRGPVRADLAANLRRRSAAGRTARTRDATLGLAWRTSAASQVFADMTFNEGSEGGTQLSSAIQRVRGEWNAGSRWRWSARAERARFVRAGSSVVVQRTLGADAAWRLGQLELTGRIEAGWRGGHPGHDYRRASLGAVRRFR